MKLLVGIAALGACAALAALLARLERAKASRWPVKARPVMSEAERHFYALLGRAIPDLKVFPQVQVCRFVEVLPVRKRYAVLNRYDRLSVDFVVAREDARVVCAIELDDASHDRARARDRDQRKEAVLNAAGVPLLRFRAGRPPSTAELAAAINEIAAARSRT